MAPRTRSQEKRKRESESPEGDSHPTKRLTASIATRRNRRVQTLGKPLPRSRFGSLSITVPKNPLLERPQSPTTPDTVTTDWTNNSSDSLIPEDDLPAPPDFLVLGDDKSYQWVQIKDAHLQAHEPVQDDAGSLGLPTGKDWNYQVLRQLGWAPKLEQFKWSEYVHWVVEGAIIAAAIMRHHGPNWSEVALAHYNDVCPDINTLKYVYVSDIVNKETAPYVKKKLYDNKKFKPKDEPVARYWKHGTEEYQRILGTAIGKGVACLVLGAWPRGTHRITQIKSFFWSQSLQLRFDIGEIDSEGSE
ncbi:uncharacterized protein MYU51_012167 [Penicillium brevicompactum]